MSSADQVFFVLHLILILGPLAVYFLGLGLVNSLARPCLVNARRDFLLLTISFVPIILVPTLSLIEHGHRVVAACVVMVIAAVFARCCLSAARAGSSTTAACSSAAG